MLHNLQTFTKSAILWFIAINYYGLYQSTIMVYTNQLLWFIAINYYGL